MVRAPSARVSIPLLLLALACAGAFLVLAIVVSRQGSLAFDEPVIAFVTGLGIPTSAWRAITELGGLILVPLGVGLVGWLALQRRYAEAVIVAVALIGATLFTDAVKDLIARPRPPGPHLAPAGGYSFPSGHTLNSTATYGIIALYAWRSRIRRGVRWFASCALLAIPFLVGLSRIALGVHYPSDVLGGWLAGAAVVLVVAAITPPRTSEPGAESAAGP
jgi:undecaprenyl-diphosphatase